MQQTRACVMTGRKADHEALAGSVDWPRGGPSGGLVRRSVGRVVGPFDPASAWSLRCPSFSGALACSLFCPDLAQPENERDGETSTPMRQRSRRHVRSNDNERGDDGTDVGVDDHITAVGMPGQVHLPHPFEREVPEKSARVGPMIPGVGIDLVDIEQEAAIGPGHHLGQELGLGHLSARHQRVVGRVLEQERAIDLPPDHLDPTAEKYIESPIEKFLPLKC